MPSQKCPPPSVHGVPFGWPAQAEPPELDDAVDDELADDAAEELDAVDEALEEAVELDDDLPASAHSHGPSAVPVASQTCAP